MSRGKCDEVRKGKVVTIEREREREREKKKRRENEKRERSKRIKRRGEWTDRLVGCVTYASFD